MERTPTSMKTADLHIHSYYSDGENSPAEILEMAMTENLALFSITDHNFVSPNVSPLMLSAKTTGPLFIQGIEISSLDKVTGKSMHILGYSRGFEGEKLNRDLEPLIDGYNRRAKKIIEELHRKHPGLITDFEHLKKGVRGPYVSRNLIAAELRDFLHQTVDMKKAIRETYIEENNSWMLSDTEAIRIITDAGGIPILAHPGRLTTEKAWFTAKIQELKRRGLRGMEVYYPSHTEDQTELLIKIARSFELVVTGGSDWHGENYTPGRGIGCNLSDNEYNSFIDKLSDH